MKSSTIFFKNCLLWLSEISVDISRINKIREKLQEIISGPVSNDKKRKAIQIMEKVDMILKKFINTEARIIHTIKKNENYPKHIYVSFCETKFAVKNEEYLSKIVHYHKDSFIELQGMVNEYIEESVEKPKTPKLSVQ